MCERAGLVQSATRGRYPRNNPHSNRRLDFVSSRRILHAHIHITASDPADINETMIRRTIQFYIINTLSFWVHPEYVRQISKQKIID